MTRAAALIAGGGPAGAAAAILLARAGARPLLIERRRAGDGHGVVCGGFLGWDALAHLTRLGVNAGALGARPIGRLRIVTARRTVESDLPFAAAGLSRAAMDAALLDAAAAAGAGIERGVAIRRAAPGLLHLAGGDAPLAGDALFVASGKYELRDMPRGHGRRHTAIGLRSALAVPPARVRSLDGVIELHPFDGGYAGLLMQEDGRANLCVSVAGRRFAGVTGGLAGLLAAVAAEAPALADLAPWLTGETASIAGIPYGWRAATAAHGVFRLGDQAAVISSIAGDGVAIALASAASAVAAWGAQGPAGSTLHARRFAARAALPLAISGAARRMAETPWLRGPAIGLLGHAPALARMFASATRIGA